MCEIMTARLSEKIETASTNMYAEFNVGFQHQVLRKTGKEEMQVFRLLLHQ